MHQAQFARVTLAGLVTALCLGGLSSSLKANQSFNLSNFRNNAQTEHNTYRSNHRSPNLKLNNSLNNTAQDYAEKLLRTGRFVHSSDNERNGAGENLFYTLSQFPLDPSTLAAKAVEAWYEEVQDYDYSDPRFSVDTGHFSQVVWKGTTEVGCGVAQGPKMIAGRNATINYVVCHYAPMGNVSGQFPSNVLQP